MNIKKKGADVNIAFWIVFFVLLGLVLLAILNRGGVFSSQTYEALKQKIFPFG